MICPSCHEEIYYGPRGCFCTRQAAKEYAQKELKKIVENVERILNDGEMEEIKLLLIKALKDEK